MILSMEETDALGEVAQLAGFLPYLEQALDKMDAALERKVFRLLDTGELTPQLAVYAWQEKLMLRRLLRTFDQKVKIATAIGERVAPEINIGVE